jgi:two-component system, NarL family, response regulator NreC
MTGDLIRVVLADDHNVVRAGLKAVLGTAKDIDVVGEAKNGEEALALVDRFHPHVVVMDLSMGGMDGLAATKDVVAKKNGTRVLVLTMHPEEDYLVPLLEAGAAGYLVKSAADRELVDAVRAVAKGDVYVRPAAARVLAKGLTKKDPHQQDREKFERLTERRRSGSACSSARRRSTRTSNASTRSSVCRIAPITFNWHCVSDYSRATDLRVAPWAGRHHREKA